MYVQPKLMQMERADSSDGCYSAEEVHSDELDGNMNMSGDDEE